MDFVLKAALPSDAADLTAIAHAAKRHWGYPEEWIVLWGDALSFTPEFVEREHVYVAVGAEEIIGVCALLRTETEAEIEHLWVLPRSMGMGVGRALLEHAISAARGWSVDRIRIVSDPNAVGFYRASGAVEIGDVAATPEGRRLPVLELVL
jgi:GNAT superfamily N-acetyltransferase